MKYLKKKGNLMDIPETAIIIFSSGILLFIMYLVLTNFGNTIKSDPATNYTQVTEAFDSHVDKYYKAVDYGFLVIIVLFTVVAFVLARYIPSDSIYLIIMFSILFLFILFSFILSNVHGAMMDNSSYETFVNTTTFYKFFMPKLPFIAIIQLILVVVGLYTKTDT